ncbi:hypothetical protein HXA35_16160 [Bacillus sp. A301a_S52]|nr:hypothetical protein [Bacillus sp. A301a_S52]
MADSNIIQLTYTSNFLNSKTIPVAHKTNLQSGQAAVIYRLNRVISLLYFETGG